ncbi:MULTISPECIES: tape measure protein [Lactobacillaceae]|uniref:tape measure protein n=1 Tax=Lactobacillaceae TaxID=33958 RepID=UPI0014570F4F|nr:tape measure protein [Lactobacillus sp. HBUAS51381]NLR08662.1 tape measure protein [Lactobacillus sp. HBUAS51381]
MADKVVSATIKINDGFSAALSKLSAGVGRGSTAMNQLSAGAGKTGGMFKSMLGANIIGAGITKGIGVITSGVGSMVGELNESSKAWQTFEGNMSMIGKSPAQISKTEGSLQKFAEQTIYSASDMASTYSQLAAVGTKNTGKLVKGFGGLAAASSDPQQAMKTLSQQATQAAAKPKIQWQDFRLMLEQTPAGMAMVAKTMHKSTGQLVKDVQAGKVKTQDFFNAIAKTGTNKSFSKMATQYKTVGQAIDGLREGLAGKLRKPWQEISAVGIKAVSSLSNSVEGIDFSGIGKGIVPVVQGVVNAVKTAGQAISAFFSSLGKTGALSSVSSALSSIGKAFGDVMGKLSSSGGKDPFAMFKTLGSISGSAIKGLADGLKAIADVAGSLDPTALKMLGAAFVALKMSTKGLVLTGIVLALTTLSKLDPGVLNALAMAIGLVAVAILTFKAAKNVSSIISKIGQSLSGLGKGSGVEDVAKSSSKAAAGFIKLGFSLLLVGGAVALTGAGLWMMAEAVTTLVSAGWPAVALFAGMVVGIGVLAMVVSKLGPAMIMGAAGFAVFGAALVLIGVAILIAAAGMTLLATQLPTIAESGAMAALNIVLLGGALAVFGALSIVAAAGLLLLGVGLAVAGVSFMVAAVGALLFGVAMMVVAVGVTIAAVGMMILAVALPLIAASTMIAAVGMLLMGTAMVVVAAVAMIAGAGMMIFALALVIAAPLMMVAAAGAILLGAASIVLGAGLMVAGAGLTVVAAGLRSVISAVSAMVSAFVNGVSRLVSGVTSGMSQVVSAVRNGMQNAVNAAKGFGSALVGAGADLIEGLVRGITSMVGKAVAAVKNVAKSVVNAAKNAMGIGSPSKIFKQYGRWVVEGLAIGLGSNQAENASRSMAMGVVGAANALNHMPSANPGNLLANGFNNAATAVGGLASAMQGINGTSVDVNGNLSGSATGNAPQSTSFGSSAGGYSTVANYSDTSSSEQSGINVTIQPGAFVLQSTSNADYDAETMVSKIETYLVNLKERRG